MRRVWLFIAVCAVGALSIGGIIFLRSAPKPTAILIPDGGADSGISRPIEFMAGGHEFDLSTKQLGASEVANRVEQRVVQNASAILGDPALAAALGEAVADRLEVTLAPDFDRWIEQVNRFTQPPPLDEKDSFFGNTFRERWEQGIDGFRAAPIALNGIIVRLIQADTEPLLDS